MSIGEDIDCSDKFWFCANWESYEKDNLPRGKLTGLHVTHIRKIEPPPKRHREPTRYDLANGPIACEVKDSKPNSPWHSRILLEILSKGDCLYRVQRPDNQYDISRWPQCRIEVAE